MEVLTRDWIQILVLREGKNATLRRRIGRRVQGGVMMGVSMNWREDKGAREREDSRASAANDEKAMIWHVGKGGGTVREVAGR